MSDFFLKASSKNLLIIEAIILDIYHLISHHGLPGGQESQR